jgi:hypothetical protein
MAYGRFGVRFEIVWLVSEIDCGEVYFPLGFSPAVIVCGPDESFSLLFIWIPLKL